MLGPVLDAVLDAVPAAIGALDSDAPSPRIGPPSDRQRWSMKRTKTWLALAAACAAFPGLAQEPVVAAADPEALFTDPDPVLHANKQVVLHIMRELIQCNYWDQADKWLSERYLQHNPNVKSGRANVLAFFGSPPKAPTCDKLTMPVVTVLTSGNIVGVVLRMEYDNPKKPGTKYTTIFYDQWRVVDGKADEHWDTGLLSE
jgi:predicted SnoaL-like aldol condensation-catalyzing enzyme